MVGKRRSGLSNHRRAYACGRSCTNSICPSITLADIATFDGGIEWRLNNNTTILACQTLTISAGIYVIVPDGLILTNNGTIINNGTMTIHNGGTITNYSTSFVNNGRIYILDGSQFINSWDGNSGPILTNNGEISIALGGILANGRSTLNNTAGGYIYNRGTITNLQAVINNYGNIINNDRGLISTENSTIYNSGGTITNNIGATINNQISSRIYNNNGGTITQNTSATFTNNGIIHNADGSSTCGLGTIVGTILGTFGTNCP